MIRFNNSTTPYIIFGETGNTLIDNFNIRLWNEENKDYEIKRAQIYML